jgi:hypothetical protein
MIPSRIVSSKVIRHDKQPDGPLISIEAIPVSAQHQSTETRTTLHSIRNPDNRVLTSPASLLRGVVPSICVSATHVTGMGSNVPRGKHTRLSDGMPLDPSEPIHGKHAGVI